MEKSYVIERDGKVIAFGNDTENVNKKKLKLDGCCMLQLQGVELDHDTITTLNDILSNGSYREKSIVEDFGSIEVPKTPYGNNVINVYNKAGDGFQVFIRTVKGSGHKKGDITG